MQTMFGQDRNEALGKPLLGLLSRLRAYPPRDGFGDALSLDADRFVETFAKHRRYADDILFPALRELEPGSACDLESFQGDHRSLQLHARDLALQIGDMGREEAYRSTRSVLVTLLDHLRRETEDVDRFVRSLEESDVRRLERTLDPDVA